MTWKRLLQVTDFPSPNKEQRPKVGLLDSDSGTSRSDTDETVQSEGARESRSRATAPPCPNGQLPPAWGPELCPTVFLDVSRLLPCVQGRAASTAEVEPGFGRKEVNFSLTTRKRGDNNTLTYGLLKTEAKKNYDAVINVNAPPQNRTENCFQKMEKGSRIGLIFTEVEFPVSRGGLLVTS